MGSLSPRSGVFAVLAAVVVSAGAATAAETRPPEGGAQSSQWQTYNLDYQGRRYSPLRQINRRNITSLAPVCEVQVGEQGLFQSGPLVIDDTLIVTTAHTTLAVDATSCQVRWRHVYVETSRFANPGNRGAAYFEGRVFRGTGDGALLALDARTGKELWRTLAGDSRTGEHFSSAPIAWDGKLFIGTSGGDGGGQARLSAYDVADGHELWRFNVIPKDGEPGAETWKMAPGLQRSGGAMWSSYSLDTQAGEVFVSTGNPGPALRPEVRTGDNLYTDSVVVLDAATGRLKWHYQVIANDALDYDLAAAPLLYTDLKGHERIAVAGKDGFLHLIDRGSRTRVAKVAVTTIQNSEVVPSVAGVRVCPGSFGGAAWNGPAVDARSKTLYVGAIDLCMQYRKADSDATANAFGTYALPYSAADAASGWIHAVDGTTGRVRWKYHSAAAIVAGVTATAGGLVLTGDTDGNLIALDSASGKLLYSRETGGVLSGGVVTYEARGKQYVAYNSGGILRGTFVKSVGKPKIVIAALGSGANKPAVVQVAELDQPATASAGQSPGVGRGGKLYATLCAVCHGEGGAGLTAPRLNRRALRTDARAVQEIIKDPRPGMARFYPGVLDEQGVQDLAALIESWDAPQPGH